MAQIQSPLPGTFYHKPSPEAAPYRVKGDKIAIGDIIGLIEVMKTFIEVKAETDGVFAGYLVGDASPVTAGEALAELEG